MKISMNSTVAFHGTTLRDIAVAKAAGFDAVELQTPKLFRFLDAGFTAHDLVPALDGFAVSGVGAIQEAPHDEFTRDATRLAEVAQVVGAPYVQMCTGPVDVRVVKDFRAGTLNPTDLRFRGALGLSGKDALAETAKRVALAADIAADHGVGLYLEPLAWSPVNRVSQALQIIESIQRPNVKMCVDFWHFWAAGDTPEDVAALPGDLIAAVHVCDGLHVPAGEVPDQSISRNVWTGAGEIPLQEWVDACKATGFDGWYCPEIFCGKVAELDDHLVATTLRNTVQMLLS
ncbi:Xylose isomerase domain protein TIM barrel [Pseudarthrobacter chlorophenolicus A6]|uniref:Xylose isomerase domain protein TIM barrel n=1 Tax=Pseudarthrobacter chlorophenolicus (strain ATCC 700700 / DSM 12829 / CIP 107037 / JCM 12360 / KCTC 9906 / NCIMB 13794 / A6) TaxID=452863 RepID=B8HDL5_PSECP|nr:sugar phosphate isomerase/epimerase family protein [Pseudarthrobacter chlorophenolicus]ACL39020.1 Xylose isomerase domain protein TIM barrel [Pseudarthrobacter chlorophenolicus A6]SDR05512.1 Sugar phosphate isomerase/epimerase [Pseudarthrobacter chlorophenolicus]